MVIKFHDHHTWIYSKTICDRTHYRICGCQELSDEPYLQSAPFVALLTFWNSRFRKFHGFDFHASDFHRLNFSWFFYCWREIDYWIFVDFQLIFMNMGVLVHPQLGLRFGTALSGCLFQEKHNFWRNTIVDDFQMILHRNGPNLLLNRGTTIKTGILTLIEFWWVP